MDEDQNNGKNVSSKMPESSSKMSSEMSSKLHPRGRPKKHGSDQERWRKAQRARRKRTRGDGRHAGPLAPLLSSESMEWHTPPEIWQPVLSGLGLERFDLDPCSPTRDGPILQQPSVIPGNTMASICHGAGSSGVIRLMAGRYPHGRIRRPMRHDKVLASFYWCLPGPIRSGGTP